jgi:uncharacterized protein YbbK (DUF523 family)
MKKILVSACLLGTPCRFDGASKKYEDIEELRRKYDIIPFCPEVEGGLKTPRTPCEIRGGKVINKKGEDYTKAYMLGAEKALKLCKFLGIEVAILKENSPSCGTSKIHNGMFDGKLINGMGLTAKLLSANGIKCYSENTVLDFLVEEKQREDAIHEAFLAREAKKAERKAAAEEAKKAKEEAKAKMDEKKPYKNGKFSKRPYGGKKFDNFKKPYRKDGKKPYSKDGKKSFSKPSRKPSDKKPY